LKGPTGGKDKEEPHETRSIKGGAADGRNGRQKVDKIRTEDQLKRFPRGQESRTEKRKKFIQKHNKMIVRKNSANKILACGMGVGRNEEGTNCLYQRFLTKKRSQVGTKWIPAERSFLQVSGIARKNTERGQRGEDAAAKVGTPRNQAQERHESIIGVGGIALRDRRKNSAEARKTLGLFRQC